MKFTTLEKILGVLWLALFAGILSRSPEVETARPCPSSLSKTKADYAPTNGKLADAYLVFNERYFYGILPIHKTTITLVDLDVMGRTRERSDGTWLIQIDRSSHPLEKEAEMTLIHEACHQEDMISHSDEGIDGHDYAFEACMVSVAKRGGFKGLW